MIIANDNEIIFEPQFFSNGVSHSDIIFKGEIIGCLMEQSGSILNPIKEKYMMLSKIENSSDFEGFFESEDEGFIFGYFLTLEKFIEYYNKINS